MSHLYHFYKKMTSLFVVLGWTFISTTLASPVCSISSFTPMHNYSVQSNPLEADIGDFNEDGRLDIVVARSTGGVTVMLNDGAGGFGAPTFYSTNSSISYEVEIGDFNTDGHLDLAVTNYFADTISLLFGTGTGTFSAAVDIPSGGLRPEYLAAGDFNRDENVDLAVANRPIDGASSITILQGDGAGDFTLTNTLSYPLAFTRAADFNNDGKLDLLTQTTALAIFMGNGQGGFSGPTSITVGASTLSFTIGDFNRDGNADIAVMAGGALLNIRVLLGNGNGTFGAPSIFPAGVFSGSYITTGDFNGDGLADLATTNASPNDGRVLVLLGNGAGGFSPATSYAVNALSPSYIVAADLNGDGRSDIISSNFDSINISVLLSTCLTPTRRFDFDRDGKADIAVYRPTFGIWYALRSSSDSLLALAWGILTDRVVAGDYDGDSITDLAVYRPSSGTWYVLRSTNNTFIAQAFGISTDVPVPADYDADGRTDIAIYRAGSWYILRSSDNQLISQSFGTAADKPVPADYDGDGKADIGVYRPSDGTWYIQQTSNNSFRAQTFGTNTDIPLSGDFDGDGKADVAVYRPTSGTWYALRSSNSSLLAQRWGVDTDIPVAADYDGDGKTDLAVFRPSNGTWYIVRSSDGALTAQHFGLSTDVPVPSGYNTIWIG